MKTKIYIPVMILLLLVWGAITMIFALTQDFEMLDSGLFLLILFLMVVFFALFHKYELRKKVPQALILLKVIERFIKDGQLKERVSGKYTRFGDATAEVSILKSEEGEDIKLHEISYERYYIKAEVNPKL